MAAAAEITTLRIEIIGVGKLVVQAQQGSGTVEHILYVVQVSQQGTCWMVCPQLLVVSVRTLV